MLFAAACGGGKDGTGPVAKPSDISSMNVGEVRVLNPTDIPNGITLPQSSGSRDYVIIVANTSATHDVAANYTVKADKSPTTACGIKNADKQTDHKTTPFSVYTKNTRHYQREQTQYSHPMTSKDTVDTHWLRE